MADYGKLLSRIWSDPDFTALDARPQLLYCLLISFSTRNHAGVLPITLKRWSKATRDASVEVITEALKALEVARFVVVDWDTEEVLIRTYIRNDEIHRQPNLMKSALKSACQVESPALRWVLHDELLRLPDHKDPAETERIAFELVDGLSRTPSEPIAEPLTEPFGEPLPEPPGVGGYVSGVREHQHLHPSPTPTAAPDPEPPQPQPQRSRTFTEMAGGIERPPPPDPGPHTTAARTMVKRIIPDSHPPEIRGKLVHHAARLLEGGTAAELVEAALALWLTKAHLGPSALGALVSEVLKTRQPTTNGLPRGTASAKAAGWLDIANAARTQPDPDQPAIETRHP